MVDIRGDDGAPARDFITDKFRRAAFADRDKFHLGSDLAGFGVMHLRDVTPRFGANRFAYAREPDFPYTGISFALPAIKGRRSGKLFHIAAAADPAGP